MSKKLDKILKKAAKDKKASSKAFAEGGAETKHLYDLGLEGLFGSKLGKEISTFLLKEGMKKVPKKKKTKKVKQKPKKKSK